MRMTTKERKGDRMRKGRAVELAGEGLRFGDLRRWGFAIASEAIAVKGAGVNIYGDALFTRKFTERDMLWPIPAVEIERNSALEGHQNPGW